MQRRLEMLGAYGKDKVYKLAEIVAATVLAGELSLAAAILSPPRSRAMSSMGGIGRFTATPLCQLEQGAAA